MTSMFRRTFLTGALALSLAASVLPSAARADDADPRKFIENLADQAIVNVADKSISETERDERFRSLFTNSFDIPEIGKSVLARYWRTATPDQQQEFVKLFEDMTVITWAKRFKDYNGEKLEVTAANHEGEKLWTVDSRLKRSQGQPIPVQWRLREGTQGLRIIDIVVEGVSMAITYRQDYNSALQGNGGKVDQLLVAMRTKVDQLKATN